MTDIARVHRWLDQHRDAVVADVETLVQHESPSNDKDALDSMLAPIEQMLEHARARNIRTVASKTFGDTFIADFGGGVDGRPHGLLLAHRDTVFPIGTTRTRPFHVREGRAYGPGAFDMKAGLVMTIWALRAIEDLELKLTRPIRLLVNADEEIGSPSSTAIIRAEAQSAAYALVLEPAKGGAVKTRRKGWSRYRLHVQGRAAHAGADPELGMSAVHEIAMQIVDILGIADNPLGTTINVGTVHGGIGGNVVAPDADAEIDCRFWTRTEAIRLDGALRSRPAHIEGARIIVDNGINRMPLERTGGVARLFSSAHAVARQLGFELAETSTGGVSDGNTAAAAGTPTLDGLGVVGAGAHSADEYVELSSLAQRGALLVGLMLSL